MYILDVCWFFNFKCMNCAILFDFFFIWKCRTWYLNYWYHFHCLWFSIGYGYDTIYFFLCYTMIWVIECPRQFFVHLLIFFWSSWHLFFPCFSKVHVHKCTFRWNTCLFFFCLIFFLPQLYLDEKVMLMVSWPWMRKVLFEHYYLFAV